MRPMELHRSHEGSGRGVKPLEEGSNRDSPTDEEDSETEVYSASELDTNTSVAFKADTYCGLMVSAVYISDPACARKSDRASLTIGFAVACLLHFLCVALEIGLPFYLLVYNIERFKHKFEVDLVLRTEELRETMARDPPQQLNPSIPLLRETLELCTRDHTVRFSQSILIFVWFAKLLPPLQDALWAVGVSYYLPTAHPHANLVSESDDNLVILRITQTLRWFFLCCVNIPRILTGVFVAYVGALFLLYAKDLGMLVIKCLALFFIVQLSEVIFIGFASRQFQSVVATASFRLHFERPQVRWNSWGSTVSKLVLVISAVLIFTRVVHRDLQEFRDECALYEALFPPNCTGPSQATCGSTLLGIRFVN